MENAGIKLDVQYMDVLSVEIDDKIKTTVTERLKIVKDELKKHFEDAVTNATSFAEANVKLAKISGTLNIQIPDDLTWNGAKLFGSAVHLTGGDLIEYVAHVDRTASKNCGWGSFQLPITTESVYCLMDKSLDFNNVVLTAATKILKAFPDKRSVYVVRIRDPKEFDDKNLSLLGFVKFEDYYTPKATRKQALGRLTFFKYNLSSFNRSSYAVFEEDKNKKLWILLKKVKEYYGTKTIATPVIKTDVTLDFTLLQNYVSNKLEGYSLYGFYDDTPAEKLEDATEGMEKLEDYLERDIKDNNIDLEEVAFASSRKATDQITLFDENEELDLHNSKTSIVNSDSIFLNYIEESISFTVKRNNLQNYRLVLTTSTREKSFGKDLEKTIADIRKQYPLFKYMANTGSTDYYNRRQIRASVEETIEYVNMVDTMKKKTNIIP